MYTNRPAELTIALVDSDNAASRTQETIAAVVPKIETY